MCGVLGNEVLQSDSSLLLSPRYVYGIHINNMHLNSLFIFSIQVYMPHVYSIDNYYLYICNMFYVH